MKTLTFVISTFCLIFTSNAQNTTSDINFVIQAVKNNQNEKSKINISIDLVKQLYEKQQHFPTVIKDGWHEVVSTDHHSFCYARKVYVENNKIIKYVVNDWRHIDLFSSPIIQAKSQIQLLNANGSKSDLVEIFFLNGINDSNSISNPPVEPGKAYFWSDMKRGGDIKIYVEGKFVGTLDSYFENAQPICGQKGTITYTNKPGTYDYKATSYRYTWTGKISITANNCSQKKLGK